MSLVFEAPSQNKYIYLYDWRCETRGAKKCCQHPMARIHLLFLPPPKKKTSYIAHSKIILLHHISRLFSHSYSQYDRSQVQLIWTHLQSSLSLLVTLVEYHVHKHRVYTNTEPLLCSGWVFKLCVNFRRVASHMGMIIRGAIAPARYNSQLLRIVPKHAEHACAAHWHQYIMRIA